MKRYLSMILSGLAIPGGIILACVTGTAALAEDASYLAKLPFTCGLILVIAGLAVLVATWMPRKNQTNIRTLSMAALFAALSYVGFAYFKIDIPVPGAGSTAFHLGNVFCVLGALFLGSFWGGMAGAVGLTIADLLDPRYITSAPKTFFLKLCIGLITGLVAHKVFGISKDNPRKLPLPVATVLSCSAGMLFNVVADPLVGYFYKMYVLGIPQDFAKALAKLNSITTLVNAVIAVIAASILYLAIRPALKRTRLLPHVE